MGTIASQLVAIAHAYEPFRIILKAPDTSMREYATQTSI